MANSVKWNVQIELPSDPSVPLGAATKQYVDNNLADKAPLDNAALTGVPTAPTAASSTNTNQLATTAFVHAAFSSWNTFTQNITLAGDLLPDVDNTRSLGSPELMWKDVYIGPGSLYLNGQKVLEDSESGTIVMRADPGQNISVQTYGTGDVELAPQGTGMIQLKGPVMFDGASLIRSSDGLSILFDDSIEFLPGAGIVGGLNIDGNAAWHAGNFNPASKLDSTATAVAAVKLATARTINGVAFDGTSNITLPAPTITKADVGLSNVDNTSDVNKPISTAVQNALNGKAATDHNHNTVYAPLTHNHDSSYATINHSHGLGDVTGLETALDGKLDKVSPTMSGIATLNGTTARMRVVGSGGYLYIQAGDPDPDNSGGKLRFTGWVGSLADEIRLDSNNVNVNGNLVYHAGNFNPADKLNANANAVSASKLATARTINGVAFDGTSNISISAPVDPDNPVFNQSVAVNAIDANTNSSVFLRDEVGANKTALFWNRLDDTFRIRKYGTSGEKDLVLSDTGLAWDNKTFWHSGNLVPSTSESADTVVMRSNSGDIVTRLFRSNYANQTTINGALAFRTNNSSDNYIRFCSDTGAIRSWLGLGSAATSSNGSFAPFADTLTFKESIPSGADLNTYVNTGLYHQNTNAGASAGLNFPVASAGLLSVVAYSAMIYQTYTHYASGTQYTRSYYNGTWYPWRLIWDNGNFNPSNYAAATHDHDSNYVKKDYGGGLAMNWASPNIQVKVDSSTFNLWHSGNFNPGSKADASHNHDSVYAAASHSHSGYVATSGDVISGPLIATGSQPVSSGIATAQGSLGGVELRASGSGATAGAAFLCFHRPGAYASYLGLDTDNKWKVGGWSAGAVAHELWHAGNFDPSSKVDLVNSGLNVSGEVISTSSNTFRMVQGNYGAFFRQDGNDLYLLITASGNQYGTWNSLRPLAVDLASGNVNMAHNVTVGGTLSPGAVSSSGNVVVSNGNGKGFGFWDNQGWYGIHMSSSGDATHGGRMTYETTSDYNMYFKMSQGTNRGFVFKNGATVIGGLDGGGNWRIAGGMWTPGSIEASRLVAGYDSGIANSIGCSGWFRSSGNSGWFSATYGIGVYATDTSWIRCYSGSGFAGGDFVISSDRRLKDSVRSFEYRGRLRPVNYYHKEFKKLDFGFIAQEVRDLYPEVVSGDESKEMLELSYPKLTAVLSCQINRVEDDVEPLKQEVSKLKTRLEAVESDNLQLRAEMAALRQRLDEQQMFEAYFS